MDIFDQKNIHSKKIFWLIYGHFWLKKETSCFHAPAQPRKGFIYGHSKKIIHEHLWLIDGHFWLKEQKHLCRNIASCTSPTPKGVYLWEFKNYNSWTFMAHWWTFVTKKTKTFMSKNKNIIDPKKQKYFWRKKRIACYRKNAISRTTA